jgi:hypothetical protein
VARLGSNSFSLSAENQYWGSGDRVRLERLKLRDGGPKPDGNSILYIPPAMARKVDRKRSILGTELEEPEIGRSGRGRGSLSKT